MCQECATFSIPAIHCFHPTLPPPPFLSLLTTISRSYLNFRFSINCFIVTSSRSTKSDFPNSKPSSSAIPACARQKKTHKNKNTQDKTQREQKAAQGRRKRSMVDFWGPVVQRQCVCVCAVGVAWSLVVRAVLSQGSQSCGLQATARHPVNQPIPSRRPV